MARRTKKSQEMLDLLSGAEVPDSTPDKDSAPVSAARREAAKSRYVSLKEAASLLDRDRNTLTKWLDQGCPYVEKADRDLGRAWVLDLGEVVRWMEKRAADAAAEKLGAAGDGVTSEDEAKRRRAVAQAIIAEVEAAETLRTVVRISAVIDRVASDYNEIKSRMMAVPDAIAGRVEQRVSDSVRAIADEQVRNALKALKADRSLSPPDGE